MTLQIERIINVCSKLELDVFIGDTKDEVVDSVFNKRRVCSSIPGFKGHCFTISDCCKQAELKAV